jgi:hypothetical protein
LISTSIVKKLVCPIFAGSLQLYPTEQAPSTVYNKKFSGAATDAFNANRDFSSYPVRSAYSTPEQPSAFGYQPSAFSDGEHSTNHIEKCFHFFPIRWKNFYKKRLKIVPAAICFS